MNSLSPQARTKVASLANVSASYTAVQPQPQTKPPKGQPVTTAGMFVTPVETKHGVRKGMLSSVHKMSVILVWSQNH